MTAKKTPLYNAHVKRGGRIVEFAGFLMPVQFSGILDEHKTVREKVGLFDVSHMGEIEIIGPRALEFADFLVTNNARKLEDGQICYTVACNEGGKVLDDLLVYRFSPERVLLVVNAVNTDKIFSHVKEVKWDDVQVANRTEEIAQIAIQGPLSRELITKTPAFSTVKDKIKELSYYRFFTFNLNGSEAVLSRTGYTGELGFEVYVKSEVAEGLWDELLNSGKDLGVKPIGLGARDTLRFEASFCLYGHELDEETSPLEAGLSWLVKLKKEKFIGKDALLKEKEEGPKRKLVGFELTGRQIARQGFPVKIDGSVVGSVTSGTFAPTLGKSLAMAYVARDKARDDASYYIEVRGKDISARKVPLPFYKSRAGEH